MRKSHIRQALWDFIFKKPSGKWEAVDRRWQKLNYLGYDLIIWLAGFFTYQVVWVIIMHLILILIAITAYWALKGR